MDGVVETRSGRIRGQERNGVWSFSGIPFAGTTAGGNRFRPPTPAPTWAGIRDALEFGPVAPQAGAPLGAVYDAGPDGQSEDCLNLNVWTPGFEGPGRPVMVWVHGGGFTTGSGSGGLYRGGRLARRAGVVAVSFNYRLGALGFLAHPSLEDEGGLGNYGLLDQLAALEWVRDNISVFGGDPLNVTIFGESAGAMSISALLGIPRSKGLFQRAVIESGPPFTHTRERAEVAAHSLTEILGLGTLDRRALESIPADQLVAATRTLGSRLPDPGEITLPLLPVIDGELLPASPVEMVANGSAAEVPLIIGTNRDEVTLFAAGDPRLSNIDDEGLRRWTSRTAPGVDTDALIEEYRAVRSQRGEPVSPLDLWMSIGTDVLFRWPSLRLAAAQQLHQVQTFVYLFVWESPLFDGALGSTHAVGNPVRLWRRRPSGRCRPGRGRTGSRRALRPHARSLDLVRRGPATPPTTWPTGPRGTPTGGPP